VLAQRVLRVHRHAPQVLVELTRGELERRGVEGGCECALGVHLADQGALAVAGCEERHRASDGRLADPALARDEEQPPVEQAHAHVPYAPEPGAPTRSDRRLGRPTVTGPLPPEPDAAVAVGGSELDIR